jgi:hypothetical protein
LLLHRTGVAVTILDHFWFSYLFGSGLSRLGNIDRFNINQLTDEDIGMEICSTFLL